MKKAMLSLVIAGVISTTLFSGTANARQVGFDDYKNPAKTIYGPWKKTRSTTGPSITCTRTVHHTNGKKSTQVTVKFFASHC